MTRKFPALRRSSFTGSNGFFLLALVIHGRIEQWWIEPVLSSLSEIAIDEWCDVAHGSE
jgi:hypothetical protein